MKLLVFFAVLACAYAGPLKCSYGPSYWCSSIATAKECGAVDHCIDTVWAHNKVRKADNDAVCDFCQGVVSQVKTLLLSNETEGRIHDYFTKACALIPDKFLSQKCQEAVDHYQTEIVKMIQAQLDPVAVCEAMGLCKVGFFDHVPHPETTVKKIPLTLGNITECADCKKFIADAVAEVTDNSTVKQIVSLLESNVCSQLGSLEPMCKQLVETYSAEIVEIIRSKADPSLVCAKLGFCSASRVPLITMKLAKTKLYKAVHSGNDMSGTLCTVCQDALAAVKLLLMNNETQAEIEQLIDDKICSELGALADECKQLVKEEGSKVFELLIQEFDPPAMCKAIGFCSSIVKGAKPVAIGGQVVHIIDTPVGGSVECTVCEYIAKELKNLISEKSTEKEIEAAVHKVCSILPSTVSKECNEFVDNYAAAIITLLVQEVTPDVICKKLNICPAASSSQAVKEVKVGASVECVLCEFVLSKLEGMLVTNASEAEIQKALDKVCSYLPTSVQAECDKLVTNYAPAILKLLVDQLAPSVVCRELGICKASLKQLNIRKPVSSPVTCEVCQYIANELDSMLTENSTEEEIKKALDKVCSYLPSSLSADCKSFIDQYADQVVELLVQEMKPSIVCTSLGLCEAASKQLNIRKPVGFPVTCQVCQYVASKLDSMLAENATEKEIQDALDKVCSYLPSSLSAECKSFIDQYTGQILGILVQGMKPSVICSVLGLCEVLPSVKANIQCTACELAMTELEKLLGSKTTEEEIKTALQNVCSMLSSSLKDECENLVQQYEPFIIQILTEEFDPKLICKTLGLCKAIGLPVKQVQMKTFTCDYCQVFVKTLQTLLSDKPTQTEIEQALLKVCSFMPTKMKQTCDSYLDTYYNVTIHTFLAMKPKECCAMTGLCAAQKSDEWVRINPLQHSQVPKTMLGRHSKCLYGPSYWCASKENAKRCQAEAHCRNHVWN